MLKLKHSQVLKCSLSLIKLHQTVHKSLPLQEMDGQADRHGDSTNFVCNWYKKKWHDQIQLCISTLDGTCMIIQYLVRDRTNYMSLSICISLTNHYKKSNTSIN